MNSCVLQLHLGAFLGDTYLTQVPLTSGFQFPPVLIVLYLSSPIINVHPSFRLLD